MSIAGAGSPDHHVIDGVVIFLPDVDRVALLQLLVTQGVQLGEGHPQVGRLEQILHLLAVRVEAGRVELDVWGQHPRLTNERRVLRVITNERRVLRVMTNERRVLRVLTNERQVLPVDDLSLG